MSLPPGTDLCTIPAAESPNGQYNFENPETLGPASIAVGVVLATISTFLTLGRVYVNRRKLGNADYCTLIACIINIAFTGVILAQYKLFRHLWDIPVCYFTGTYFRILYVQTFLFAPIFFTSKASIFLLYRQIFAIEKRVKVLINIGLLITLVVYLPNIPLSAIFEAPRYGDPWESMLTSHESSKMIIWGILQSSMTVVLDFYIFFLPLPIIIRLQMPMGKRLQLAGIFTTALMGVVASVLSLVYRIKLLHTTDTLWYSTVVAICAMIEVNVAIIVSSLPAFAQLLRLHVGESAFFRSLLSGLLGRFSNNDSNKSSQGHSEERPKLATIGSAPNPTQRRRNYYELTDTALLESRATAGDIEPETHAKSSDGIFRSTVISQHGEFRSTERLA